MSSGTSTPRTASATPIPPAGDPAPLTIGTRFVKQYYHEISTSPELIVRFYQPSTSVVTVGSGSDPATDVTDLAEAAAARFRSDNGPVGFEFEHGAIDAQLSVNGGVLLVVTGQMISSQTKKSFVHTFFLGVTTTGSNSKKSYFIHNDILRFLYQEENGAAAESAAPAVVEAAEGEIDDIMAGKDVGAAAPSALLPLAVEEAFVNHPVLIDDLVETVDIGPTAGDVAVSTVQSTLLEHTGEILTTAVVTAPGRGVEESKEAVLADEEDDDARAVSASKQTTPAAPGSWASMVARKTTTPPSTPSRIDKGSTSNGTTTTAVNSTTTVPQATTPVKAAPETAALAPTATAAPSVAAAAPTGVALVDGAVNPVKPSAQPILRPHKRDPDCTLVIKNIDANVTEAEVLGLFSPFTADTTGKVMGCTVQAHRGIAFVDYDSPEPVLKAVAQQTDVAPFVIRERKLEIYQKTVEQRSRGPNPGGRGGGRGGYRGGGRDYRNSGDDRGDGGRGGGGRYFRRGDGNRNHGGGRGGSGRGGVGAPTATTGGR